MGFFNQNKPYESLVHENVQLRKIIEELNMHFASVAKDCETMISSNQQLIEKCKILTTKQQLINGEDNEMLRQLKAAHELIATQQQRIKALESKF